MMCLHRPLALGVVATPSTRLTQDEDVSVIEGEVEVLEIDTLSRPSEAWREVNELLEMETRYAWPR
jgi:hypothetical protein